MRRQAKIKLDLQEFSGLGKTGKSEQSETGVFIGLLKPYIWLIIDQSNINNPR